MVEIGRYSRVRLLRADGRTGESPAAQAAMREAVEGARILATEARMLSARMEVLESEARHREQDMERLRAELRERAAEWGAARRRLEEISAA